MYIRVIPRQHVTGRRDACCTDGAPRVFLEGDGGLVASNRPVGGWGAGRVTQFFFTQTLACMHECIRCPETPSGTLEERKLGVSRVYIAHDHLGRAERRLESAILICALLQLFSWVSGRLNALLHACQSLVKKWVTRHGTSAQRQQSCSAWNGAGLGEMMIKTEFSLVSGAAASF